MQKLGDHGLGCHIWEVFVACILFAVDIILISPSRGGAQMLLTICDKWAQESGVMFSTDPNPEKSKSKAMWVGGKTKKVEPVYLC